jgi:hypothetical protein
MEKLETEWTKESVVPSITKHVILFSLFDNES